MSIKVKVVRAFLSRNTREKERVGNGFVLVCFPENQRKVFSFPGCYNVAADVTQQTHTLICYQRSQVHHWPWVVFASGAQSLFLPRGSRGVTLLTNQQLLLLQHSQIALLSKTVIICFLSDGLINETAFGQYENKVVVLDCQM